VVSSGTVPIATRDVIPPQDAARGERSCVGVQNCDRSVRASAFYRSVTEIADALPAAELVGRTVRKRDRLSRRSGPLPGFETKRHTAEGLQ
jgi:hypothetical protein